MTIEMIPSVGNWLVTRSESGERIADGDVAIINDRTCRVEHIDLRMNSVIRSYLVIGRPMGEGGSFGSTNLESGETDTTQDGIRVKAS